MNVTEWRVVLREARQWVEANTANVRGLSPEAAAPGEAMLAKIDAALASSDPTPATEAGDAAMLAASPLPSSSGTGWRPIETAPKDGTRILIKAVTFGWSSDVCQNAATGDKAVEARWAKDLSGEEKWLEWCGNDRTYSIGGALVPLGWMPLPTAPVSHGGA